MKTPIHLLACALILWLSPSASATAIYALTNDNRLLVVDATVPQNVLSIRTITGLDAGDVVVGIDVRPLNGQLYALSNGEGLYTINPATAAATKVAELAADPADVTPPVYTGMNGTIFSIDFNPVVDRLRVVSDAEQNLRIHPDTGLVMADLPLAYAVGDANENMNPQIGGIAYSNNIAGAATTSLFGIDDETLQIVLQNPPNSGTLNSNAPFGHPNATHVGFDIAPGGTAYVGGKHEIPGAPIEFILATVDPATGLGDSHGPIGDGTIPIRDLAVAPTLTFSAPHYAIFENGGSATITVNREGFLNTSVAVQFTTLSQTASAGSDYTTAFGTLSFSANETTQTFQVPILNDIFPEIDETLGLLLSNVTGPAVIGAPDIATLRVNANDLTDLVGPLVEFIGLTGPSRGIDGAVVHFNEDMDPVSATTLTNYKLMVLPREGAPQTMLFTSAVYDPVERSVTLGLAPFMQTTFKKMALRIKGKAGGVADVAGNLIDGNANGKPGGDALQLFKVFSGTTLTFADRDGDAVTLQLTGGGQLDGVRPIGGPATQHTQFWILDPIALQTSINGTVAKSPRGNGLVVIAEIIGLDKKEFTPLITNPSFRVNTLTFSSNATGR